jgi:hypothetical protein
MARIRTIKPEFPQSESMGRVTRDARLLFILLWTISDDSGRTRANSRMLASLLFPYDEDAGEAIDGWLTELEREGCIVRYEAASNRYLQICKWLNHQKIDRASDSKIPAFDEASRIVANPREDSSEDQGSRIKEGIKEGIKDQGARAAPAPKTKAKGKSARSPSFPMPNDFCISDAVKRWAADKRFDRLEEHFEAFKNKALAKGYQYADWDAAFRSAVADDWAEIRSHRTNSNGKSNPLIAQDFASKTYEGTPDHELPSYLRV